MLESTLLLPHPARRTWNLPGRYAAASPSANASFGSAQPPPAGPRSTRTAATAVATLAAWCGPTSPTVTSSVRPLLPLPLPLLLPLLLLLLEGSGSSSSVRRSRTAWRPGGAEGSSSMPWERTRTCGVRRHGWISVASGRASGGSTRRRRHPATQVLAALSPAECRNPTAKPLA